MKNEEEQKKIEDSKAKKDDMEGEGKKEKEEKWY